MENTDIERLMFEIKSIKYDFWPIEKLVPYENNPRNNDHAVDKMVNIIKEFGMPVPICIKPDGTIADGHLRLKAAKFLGLPEIPVAINETWSPQQLKAFRISVNKASEFAEWNKELLSLEMEDLQDLGFDLEIIGFTPLELENIIGNDNLIDNHKEEWKGMPEFDQQDKTAFRSIIVHFKDNGAVSEFCELLNQNITNKTKMIWFPEIEIETVADKSYGSES